MREGGVAEEGGREGGVAEEEVRERGRNGGKGTRREGEGGGREMEGGRERKGGRGREGRSTCRNEGS